MKPTQEKIDQIKAQFPDREVYAVDAVAVDQDKNEDYLTTFLMTGPLREEYKMYVNKVIASRDEKDDANRLWAQRMAVENAALAQIRWPDREEARKAFDGRQEMVDLFAEKLREMAGANVELRTKKL